ncbi:MAG: FHA domain-containing protein [Aridibacter famidurans]|nr:FHA domain-containing protein [Aridibacter famidurans]
MPEPVLLIDGEDRVPLDRGLITIGRASDNVIAFTEDSNVSRYHAEIENRGEGDYWIFDLNSSNGTKVNGETLTVEKPLFDGDVVIIGGSHKIEVVLTERAEEDADDEEEEPEEEETAEEEQGPEAPPEGEAPQKPKLSMLFIIAGLALGLAVIAVGVALAVYLSGGGGGLASGCEASARIVNPQNGDILEEATDIEIELTDPAECVVQTAYTIDDKVVATSDTFPFKASIDPANVPGLSDGLDHTLKVVLIDADGNQAVQPAEIALNFNTLATDSPSPTPGGGQTPGTGGQDQTQPGGSQVSLTDTKSMTERIIPQFSGQAAYVTGNPGFLDAVSRYTAEYAEPGFFSRASKYRDVINTEFIQERALDPPLGYLLAMSRSKFQPTNDQKGAGLWRMDNELVLEFNYNGLCGAETIASPAQGCAAIASSSYLKDMLLKAFGGNSGDIIYVVAAFGMKPLEATQWRQTLPEDRSDFWRVLERDPQKQEAVARFFAASIVAENPGRFGLQDDKPLSTLYRDAMRQAAPAAGN